MLLSKLAVFFVLNPLFLRTQPHQLFIVVLRFLSIHARILTFADIPLRNLVFRSGVLRFVPYGELKVLGLESRNLAAILEVLF